MSRKSELKILKQKLNDSKTEEDIFECLIHLVKGYGVNEYIEVFENPFYKSLLPDIKKDVLEDIKFLKESLENEIEAIDRELSSNINSDTLKSLKRDCISLIYEIDERKKDIENLR